MNRDDDKPLPAVGAYWIREEDYPAARAMFIDGRLNDRVDALCDFRPRRIFLACTAWRFERLEAALILAHRPCSRHAQ